MQDAKSQNRVLGRKDAAVERAKHVLKGHFETKKGAPARTPYYHRQMQVLYENDFFDWVVTHALNELEDEGVIASLDSTGIPELARLRNVPNIKFYANAKAVKTASELERMKTHAVNIAKVVDEYSQYKHTEVRGKHLEALVEAQLRISQFQITGRSTNTYNGKKWNKTNHDLDIIAKRNNLVIGVEVKNTLSTIPSDEIDTKIQMCHYLGIVPVFAVRWIKPYIQCIRKQGGFSWVFKTQMLPLGYEEFVGEIYRKLSVKNKEDSRGHSLEFPINVRTDLPPKSVEKFETWANNAESNPPKIDTSVRCGKAK